MSGRTLVITNDFPPRPGGIESFVLAMAKRFPPGQVVVHTARRQGAEEFDGQLDFPVIRDKSPIMLPTPGITRRSIAIAREHGCDRVWFGAAAPLALMAPKLREAGIERMVATTHGHEVWWAVVPFTRGLMRRIGRHVDVLTYLGDYTRSRIAPALDPASRARFRQLTPGVDDVLFNPEVDGSQIRAELGLGDRPVVVCVSRMVARKGQDVLVEALPLIREKVPDAALLLVGDGPYRSEVERRVTAARLGEHVFVTGRVSWERIPEYFAAGDVFCMPARTRLAGFDLEGLGICYLEAAATGLPVVAGDSGGAPDAVLEGENGFVVDGTDARAVAERCAELLLDRDLAAKFGRRGREWVGEKWRWDDLAVQLQRMLAGDRVVG
ncbi:glycosyltransferase family 4 protein [Kineosporia sp. NBRC 101731]|uniref:glycosyltransferase family 4 protein n=1 Tax=Kineosporia sp. NBRC 101731 TaxID=3032199 RepID=UPI0024A14C4F|nr:glycosyltransferase family 4 protein [Kineosporia sp. NBRC 101731]GLY32843.1 glycosyl transferase family 1 [Kineosporia sp. NBRC 101731]